MKRCLIILFLFGTNSLFAQNLRLLKQFDAIQLSSNQYEAEGLMSPLKEFVIIETNKFKYNDYDWVKYGSNDGSIIYLCFYKGILYLKKLTLKYPINQMQDCKDELKNIQAYITSNNAVLQSNKGIISNKAYGGDIGVSYDYYLTKSTKNYRAKDVSFSASLSFDYPDGKSTAKIIGYQLDYESVDLNKTDLDAKIGYTGAPQD